MTSLVIAEAFGVPSIASWFKKQWANHKDRQQVKTTIKELSALSDRELHDMGISRCDIYTIAHGASDNPRNANLKGWV